MLVVTVVMGLLFVMLAGGVSFGMRGWSRQDSGADRLAAEVETEAALRRLLVTAQSTKDNRLAGVAKAAFSGLADRVLFVGSAKLDDDRRRDIEIAIGVDSQRRLMLRWRILRSPGCSPTDPMREEVLTPAVTALHVRYWGGDAAPGWHPVWSANTPPALIGLTIVPIRGKPWTEIMIHPLAAQNDHDTN